MSTSQICSCCRQASVQEQSASVKPAATAETDHASDAERASSRLFSRRATLVTGALASTAALASCAEGGGTTVTAPDGTVDMAAASSVGVGKAAKLTRGTTTVIVAQPSEGQYKAYSPVCTHQGCQLQVQDSNRIVCPLPRFGVRAHGRFGAARSGGDPAEDLFGAGEGRPYLRGKQQLGLVSAPFQFRAP